MKQNAVATTPAIDSDKQKDGKGWKIATAIVSVVAVCGIGFGGFELYLNTKNSPIDTPSTFLSLDKNSNLGKKLYEQINSITATGFCEQYYPLYDFPEDEYIIKYEDLSSSVKFEIIAEEIPEIANLKNNGDKTIVSGEKMEEVFDSVFGDYGDITYGIFGFTDLNTDEYSETQHIHLADYDIEPTGDNEYLVSLKREPRPACSASRYHSYYEYLGLLNTIDNQVENNNQTATIVLEKKTIDNMVENDAGKSDGYYGVLFKRRQDSGDYFWVGAYYLGN